MCIYICICIHIKESLLPLEARRAEECRAKNKKEEDNQPGAGFRVKIGTEGESVSQSVNTKD